MITRYTKTAMFLHWFIAILILAALFLGLSLEDMALSPAKIARINYHKWLGISVLWLAAVRLYWRLTHPAPAMPESMKSLEKKAAHFGHLALYFFMFAIPLSGWLMSSAKGYPVVYLGLVQLPDLVPKSNDLADIFKEMHELLAWSMVALLIGHVLAALKHQFIDKTPIFARILPSCCCKNKDKQ